MRRMTPQEITEVQRAALEPALFRVQVVVEVWVAATYQHAAATAADHVDAALIKYKFDGPGVRTSKTLGRA